MNSKLSLLFSLFLVLGCAKESQPREDVVTVKHASDSKNPQHQGMYCIKDIKEQFKLYRAQKMDKSDLQDFWNCTSNAISLFHEFSPPIYKSLGRYPVSGINRFLKRYFFKDSEVPVDLLKQIYQLKVVLLGGSANFFTDAEISELQSILSQDLLGATEVIRPDLSVLLSGTFAEKVPGLSLARVTVANEHLALALRKVAVVFSRHEKSYRFSQMQSLFESLKQHLEHLTPVVREAKALLIGPNRKEIQADEWSPFFERIGNGYQVWLTSANFLDRSDFYQHDSLGLFYKIVDQTLLYLKVGLNKRSNSTYSDDEANMLFAALHDFSGLPFGLELKTAAGVWNLVVEHIFRLDSEIVLDAPNSGLTPEKINFVSQQVYSWYLIQDHLNHHYGPEFKTKDDSLGELKKAFLNLKMSLDFDQYNRLKIPNEQAGYGITSLSTLNLVRAGTHLLMRAYAKDSSRSQNQTFLTIEEISILVSDIKPLGVSMGLLTADDNGFAKKVYRDTSLFLPSSNGDKNIDYQELLEYLYFIASGYYANQHLFELMPAECTTKTQFLAGNVEVECLRAALWTSSDDAFSHVPKLKDYFQSMHNDPKKWDQFFQNLIETVSGRHSPALKKISIGDVFEINVLSLYIETFMKQFDQNQDDVLSPAEIDFFLKDHLIPIGQLTPFDPDVHQLEIKAFLTYILKYQRSPLDPTDRGADMRFSHWIKTQDQWQFSAERLNLSAVLNNLANL